MRILNIVEDESYLYSLLRGGITPISERTNEALEIELCEQFGNEYEII